MTKPPIRYPVLKPLPFAPSLLGWWLHENAPDPSYIINGIDMRDGTPTYHNPTSDNAEEAGIYTNAIEWGDSCRLLIMNHFNEEIGRYDPLLIGGNRDVELSATSYGLDMATKELRAKLVHGADGRYRRYHTDRNILASRSQVTITEAIYTTTTTKFYHTLSLRLTLRDEEGAICAYYQTATIYEDSRPSGIETVCVQLDSPWQWERLEGVDNPTVTMAVCAACSLPLYAGYFILSGGCEAKDILPICLGCADNSETYSIRERSSRAHERLRVGPNF